MSMQEDGQSYHPFEVFVSNQIGFVNEKYREYLESIRNLKCKPVVDGNTGLMLSPFVASPDEISLINSWEMALSDEAYSLYMGGERFHHIDEATHAIVFDKYYKKIVRDDRYASFIVLSPLDEPIGFIQYSGLHEPTGTAVETILMGEKDQGWGTVAVATGLARMKQCGFSEIHAEVYLPNFASVAMHQNLPIMSA